MNPTFLLPHPHGQIASPHPEHTSPLQTEEPAVSCAELLGSLVQGTSAPRRGTCWLWVMIQLVLQKESSTPFLKTDESMGVFFPPKL